MALQNWQVCRSRVLAAHIHEPNPLVGLSSASNGLGSSRCPLAANSFVNTAPRRQSQRIRPNRNCHNQRKALDAFRADEEAQLVGLDGLSLAWFRQKKHESSGTVRIEPDGATG